MKELSIEEKAKRYDEALKAVIVAYKDEDRHLKATLERIFPELKESEDEKIRKRIISALVEWEDKCSFPGDSGDMIAWLEKQGEQKPQGKSALEALDEEKVDNANKVEQKPAWSEEDEAMWTEISDLLWEGYKQSGSKFSWDDIRNWVNTKLLKGRVQPQNTWKPSDEQIKAVKEAACYSSVFSEKTIDNLIALSIDLKKLKG